MASHATTPSFLSSTHYLLFSFPRNSHFTYHSSKITFHGVSPPLKARIIVSEKNSDFRARRSSSRISEPIISDVSRVEDSTLPLTYSWIKEEDEEANSEVAF
ncbi:hypothetical protein QN277_024705 [Acacia crassicarpa]|uniref:Uncharacterized protein n=1 Tax=Acacia crassicarpa TaxID=499986 RepID=A0AAE1JCT5_9FABA|nr:hypothetical protein QN277_024705 [Acacia crassicarpa]